LNSYLFCDLLKYSMVLPEWFDHRTLVTISDSKFHLILINLLIFWNMSLVLRDWIDSFWSGNTSKFKIYLNFLKSVDFLKSSLLLKDWFVNDSFCKKSHIQYSYDSSPYARFVKYFIVSEAEWLLYHWNNSRVKHFFWLF
jgi:hypothetical protein